MRLVDFEGVLVGSTKGVGQYVDGGVVSCWVVGVGGYDGTFDVARVEVSIGIRYGVLVYAPGGLHHGLVAAFPEFGSDVVGVCNDRYGGHAGGHHSGTGWVGVGGRGLEALVSDHRPSAYRWLS